MTFYVYILQSEKDGSFYKGISINPVKRLVQHNNCETQSTRHLVPWKLVHVELMPSKRNAIIRKKNLYKADRARIIALIQHSKNILGQFIY